jgi:hypothetical protein
MKLLNSETYRVRETALAILSTGGERVPVTLPINAILILVDGPLDGNRLVEVTWEGKTLMMFTQDMRDRCDFLGPAVSRV